MENGNEQETTTGYTLLIADDEENILHGMQRYIEAHTTKFCKILCASNGQQALEMILQYRPQVLLLDIQMPVKSGLEVMRESRAAGVCPRTVILSGYDTFAYAQQALRLGAVDYMLKPCRSADLLQKLESLVPGEAAAPAQAGEALPASRMVQQAIAYCKEHLSEEITLGDVARHVAVSPAYLSRQFGRERGGFVDYLNGLRIHYACDYMRNSSMKMYEIAYAVGFRDEKYFSKVFKKVTGQSPSTYRNQLDAGAPLPL
ncbi:MAG: response regulator [Pygmaiobacter sp.]|nr:response regulator [Pygmaiobacter sp.]